MRRKSALPELLAPAGNMDCLVAAVNAGADAVYVGGKRFGARAYAKNFELDELAAAVRYCHIHGRRLYVTVNTLVLDKEMREVVEYAKELYKIGVDAIIIADLGAISEIKRCVPNMPLHASTQMSAHNVSAVNMAARLGCERAVPARELSLSDIRTVVEESCAEVEVFLHGALCVCHSGQCLFSSMVGGRSGNRGECAQPCRLPFNNGKYPLSLKDLSLAEHITELIDSGVASLKIEGRMKSAEYVYNVTRVYRRLLDERRNANREECSLLRSAFSRGGFTDGYFTGKTEGDMTGIRSESDKEISKTVGTADTEIKRVRVTARAKILLGEPSELTLTRADGKKSVTVTGDVAARAENAPLTKEGVTARLSKMGNTLLALLPEDVELVLDEGVNLSPASLNALRRRAAEAIEDSSRELQGADFISRVSERRAEKRNTALFFDENVFLSLHERDREYFDNCFVSLFASDTSLRKARGVYLPPVIFDSEREAVRRRLCEAESLGVTHALVGNVGHIDLIRELSITPVGDFRLNITNSHAKEVYKALGIGTAVLSPELTLPMARDIGGAVIVYGRIPLMITERCFIRENCGCDKCSSAALVDRMGERFPMKREAGHRNLIFNSKPTYMGDKKGELEKARLASHHFIFSTESASEVSAVISAFRKGAPLPFEVRRVGKRKTKR